MKLKPIISSLLDTDLYKLNMQQVMFHKHPNLMGEYYFKCRNKDVIFTQEMLEEINAQIDHLCKLRFTDKELDYLRTIRFLKEDYIQFLRFWRPMRDYVTTSLTGWEDSDIEICGTCTDICVVSNALIIKAQFPERKVRILSKLCAGLTSELHEAALKVMKSCQCEIV